MKSSKTSFLRNCISGWNVRCLSSPKISCTFAQRNTGCSSVRLECASGGREVAGSNPVIPTKAEIKGVKSMA